MAVGIGHHNSLMKQLLQCIIHVLCVMQVLDNRYEFVILQQTSQTSYTL